MVGFADSDRTENKNLKTPKGNYNGKTTFV
jgi:hypothetical protein